MRGSRLLKGGSLSFRPKRKLQDKEARERAARVAEDRQRVAQETVERIMNDPAERDRIVEVVLDAMNFVRPPRWR
jgi:hypothetical protein